MRNLEDIEKDLAAAREALSHVEGKPAEVYSRIVGYYRSVRNWNKGKREEYGERRLFEVRPEAAASGGVPGEWPAAPVPEDRDNGTADRLLLFVRAACPACPGAKDAAGRLGIPVDMVNADTEAGLAEAARRNVWSTPTAILLSGEGKELDRVFDSLAIASLGRRLGLYKEDTQEAAS
ncbi:MAG: anaerobic ribonucleoside-triphosphate reductase [Treponema sp.]|jgi:ribonucleoside-triphosphate reductase|nr:anaerobic ribonucleoside-triphosphate reductase [Treponema sp.]